MQMLLLLASFFFLLFVTGGIVSGVLAHDASKGNNAIVGRVVKAVLYIVLVIFVVAFGDISMGLRNDYMEGAYTRMTLLTKALMSCLYVLCFMYGWEKKKKSFTKAWWA